MPKAKLSEEEIVLFRAAVKDVKPLKKSDKREFNAPRSLPRRIRHISTPEEIAIDEFSDHLTETVTTEQVLFFARPDLPQKVVRELKQGKIKQGAVLDLHGHTVAMARNALAQMIAVCLQRGIRCFKVIHGKGKLQNTNQPILKNQVNNWLRQHPAILAFCSARAADGGTGAIYVLLRRK